MSASLWSLAGVEAEAFAPRRGYWCLNRVMTRALMMLALVSYERRTDVSGQALCLLRPRRSRQAIIIGAAAFLTCLIAGASPVAGLTGVVLLIVLLGPRAVRSAIRARQRGALRQAIPKGQYVYVHSVASARSGAGAELLERLVREADSKGWSLLLDADNERLASYYGRFGFVRVRQTATIKAPAQLPMWRPPGNTGGRS